MPHLEFCTDPLSCPPDLDNQPNSQVNEVATIGRCDCIAECKSTTGTDSLKLIVISLDQIDASRVNGRFSNKRASSTDYMGENISRASTERTY